MIGSFEKAKRYIEHQSNAPEESRKIYNAHGPCITISRQTGAGALEVSEKLVEFFKPHSKPNSPEWTVFDKNLIDKVLEDHNLPSSLSKVMGEERYSSIQTMVIQLLGGSLETWSLVRKTTETILQLANIGSVIIIGRGANIITANMNNVFHVRLFANLETRIKRIMKVRDLSRSEAITYIEKDDQARKNYLKTYFNKDIDNPTIYHMVLNTSMLSTDEAVDIIGTTVMHKYQRLFKNSSYVSQF